ncbi:MAG TPA: FkbM family methyltransferase [Acidimicrobiales bacterium]|nr:FkbM family methyltransferase [Acidimicrobiales bacterium]
MASTEHARHQAMRVWQTPRAFSNWAVVLADMAREKVGRGPETLRFNTRDGLVIECPNRAGARVPIYEIFAEDCYHFEWFLGPLAGQPLQVLDVGGQIGTFACRLAQLEAKATIRTYEPSPTSASVLRRNVERNHFGDRITVVEEALAATVGTAELDDNEGGSGTNSLVGAQGSSGATVTVATTTFDAAVAALPGPPNVVKIDCEGGEYDLVAASSPESWAAVERLVIEYHKVPGHSWDELKSWFGGVGLTVQHTEPLGEGLGVVWLSRETLARLAA